MRRFNHGLLIITLLILAATSAVAQSIFVSNDEHFTSQAGLPLANDTQLALNTAAWLTAQSGKNILILSSNFGLNNNALQTLLVGTGYTVTRTTVAPASLVDANGAPLWDAVFVSGDCRNYPLIFSVAVCNLGFGSLNTALINYVNAGGNVLLEVGLTCFTGDPTWNTFLHNFGLSIVHGCNGILASQVNVSTFQIQPPYGPGLFSNVNTVYIDNGENVVTFGNDCGAQVFTDANGNGLYGAWRPCCTGGSNLLVNGSFETGDFTAWTEFGNFQFTQIVSGPFYSYSGAEAGNFYAVLGPVGSDGGIDQNFPTIPGQMYTVCFWIAAVGDQPSDFSAFWNSSLMFGRINPNTGAVWRQYGFRVLSTQTTNSVVFRFRDDPGYIALDNVTVSP